MRFSRTRVTDVFHRRHSVSPARPGKAWVQQQFRQGRPTRALGQHQVAELEVPAAEAADGADAPGERVDADLMAGGDFA